MSIIVVGCCSGELSEIGMEKQLAINAGIDEFTPYSMDALTKDIVETGSRANPEEKLSVQVRPPHSM